MKKIFRYGVIDVYLVMVYVLTFLLLILALISKQEDKYLTADQEGLENGFHSCFNITTDENPIEFPDMSKYDVFSYLSGVRVSVDELGQDVEAQIILGGTELFPATVIKGELPMEGGSYAVIGRALQTACARENGTDYVQLDGYKYQVSVVVGSADSEAEDYLLYLWFDGVLENTKRHIENSRSLSLHLVGEETKVLEAVSVVKTVLSEQSPQCIYVENHGVFSMETVLGTQTQEYLMLYVFCIVNSIIATELWVYVRKREIAVRKAYGFNSFLCFCHFYIENLKLGFFSSVISLLLICGFGYWKTKTFYNTKLFVRCLPEFILMSCGTVLLVLLFYIVKAHLASSMDALIQEGSEDDD